MARYTGPSCKLCRREGKKLFLKGDRCLSDKCAVARRATVPGQHGAGRKTVKEYGLQHREKMTARRYYGVQEKQFHEYYVKADKKAGVTGENMLTILECRLDNVVYRMGLASSRKEARQMVRHAHFTLNGKKVDIPSYELKVGDVVSLKESSRKNEHFRDCFLGHPNFNLPYFEKNEDEFSGKFTRLPERSEIPVEVNDQYVVEYYSK